MKQMTVYEKNKFLIYYTFKNINYIFRNNLHYKYEKIKNIYTIIYKQYS